MRLRKFSTILLFFCGIILFSSCSEDKKSFRPKINDEAELIKPKTILSIEQDFIFPPDIPVYIRTINELPLSKIGFIADDMMKKEPYWSEVRPKKWYDRLVGHPSHSTGIYILVSREPQLIQIRYGKQITLQAIRSGLTAGPTYQQIQQTFSLNESDEVLLNTVKWLSAEIPKALDMPWYLEYLSRITAFTIDDFIDLSYPSEGFYTNWIFKPYIKTQSIGINLISFKWIVPIINALVYWIIRILIIGIILGFFLRKISLKISNITRPIVILVISIFLSFPSVGSLIMLTQGRMEDEIALSNLGIVIPHFLKLSNEMLSINTGLLLALLVIFVRLIYELLPSLETYLLASLPDKIQEDIFEKSIDQNPMGLLALMSAYSAESVDKTDVYKHPFTAMMEGDMEYLINSSLRWLVLLLILPKAIAMYTLLIFLLPIPVYLFKARKTYKRFTKFKKEIVKK